MIYVQTNLVHMNPNFIIDQYQQLDSDILHGRMTVL